ncbi:hypothetical protein B0H14DRAFT_3027652 [Mycena olivaceomarginata]|nr:hypothetical protein B0H14DRAFT_3027652 [Mycena olivaceomarginata]
MILSTIFLNPTARIFNLRFFLLSNIPVIVVSVLGLRDPDSNLFAPIILGFSCGVCIHHLLACCIFVMIFIIRIFDPVYIPSMVLLFLCSCLSDRHGRQTKELLLTQRLAFLGGCTQTNPPYTPQSILLNRSLARPLGESKYIIFARAFILSCIALGVPAFGIFAVVIRPVKSAVSTRDIVRPTWPEDHSGPGNVSVSFSWFRPTGDRDPAWILPKN